MKKTILILINIILFSVTLHGQDLNSLFARYVDVKTNPKGVERWISGMDNSVKCGFNLVNEVRLNYDKFSDEQREVLSSLFQRPQNDTSIISPAGKFKIHFDLTGSEIPKYDINEFALSLDSAYNYEVNIIGFPPAPGDQSEGGDDLYDVYIKNLGGGLYGYTELESPITSTTYTSFTVVDDDYLDYYSTGIDGAKVAGAHEYHHAIQIGNYIYRSSDSFYYEITSTSMEEFVFDDINDYYSYMISYFTAPNKTISANSGYDLTILNLYLKERFGFEIIKRIWELMPLHPALEAISLALEERGSSFISEFNNFGLWTYFTGSRTIENRFFEEAANYPLINPMMSIDLTSDHKSVALSSSPVSNIFLVFNDKVSGNLDNIVSIITNGDVQNGIESINSNIDLEYHLYSSPQSDAARIAENYYSKIVSSNVELLSELNVFNNNPIGDCGAISDVGPLIENVNLYVGSNFNLTWHTDRGEGLVDIFIDRNHPAGNWEMIIDNAVNDGAVNWIVEGSTTNSAMFMVRCDRDSSSWDVSQHSFAILNEPVSKVEVDYCYPQPYYYSKDLFLYLPAPGCSGSVDLNVYSMSMTLVYSGQKSIEPSDKLVVAWDARDLYGSKLPTGVYLFVTKCGDEIKKGKLIIYND